MSSLRKVISGGQNGADQAGLFAAKRFSLETGGTIPKGFKTLDGSRPELGRKYGLVEHDSESYVPRTYQNVKDSDGTVRLAGNFDSRGELCTLKALEQYNKPYFDVDLSDPPPVRNFVDWLANKNIVTLNVAGNAEQTFKGCFAQSVRYLTSAFFMLGREMSLTDDDLLEALGLDTRNMILYTSDRKLVDRLTIRQIGQGR